MYIYNLNLSIVLYNIVLTFQNVQNIRNNKWLLSIILYESLNLKRNQIENNFLQPRKETKEKKTKQRINAFFYFQLVRNIFHDYIYDV